MITRNSALIYHFSLPQTWYDMIHVLCRFIFIREAHNEIKHVITVLNYSERFTLLSIKILRM